MEALDTKEEVKVKIPKKWKVIMHNDDYTTMNFVIDVLTKVFNKSEDEAEKIMLSIHLKGFEIVGVYSKDIAFTKIEAARKMIDAEKFPLKITAEEE